MDWSGILIEGNKCIRIYAGKPLAKQKLGRMRRRSEDNIKINHMEIDYQDVYWTELAQDQV
jgi:hypothetical protein